MSVWLTVSLFWVHSVSNGSTLVPKSSIISSQVGAQSGDSRALLEDPVEMNFILVCKIPCHVQYSFPLPLRTGAGNV